MKLAAGLYEQLITREVQAQIDASSWIADTCALDEDAAEDLLTQHLAEAIRRAMREIRGENPLQQQVSLANQVLTLLRAAAPEEVVEGDAVTPALLLSLLSPKEVGLGKGKIPRPGIPLRHSDLIVNGPRDLRVGLEMARELASADRVDLLMSFVKWSGFVEIKEALAGFCGRGALRVLTTTYMGATDGEALEALRAMGAEIRVSYDARQTRLHAKAWLFHRDSGFSTALVGSSNLSAAALRDGREWNVRLSTRDNPSLVAKFRTTFEQYWEHPSFEPYEAGRFAEALAAQRGPAREGYVGVFQLVPLPHQAAVLAALEAERAAGHLRNLVVAATGTGKTVIAALDYARQPRRPSLLFVAHRESILEQSLATFRVALRDGSFGEKLVGGERPVQGRHVFASIQSLHARRLRGLDPEAYEVVVIDEFHHAAAESYRALLDYLRPRLLLGLTATPERGDGQSVLGWFDGRVAAQSRLWDALDQDLLAPFQYFALHDDTDLSQVDFRGGRYEVSSLERLYTADEHRARQVLRALHEKVRAPREMRALGFCVSVAHAEFMAEFFRRQGLPAAVVTGETDAPTRRARVTALELGDLVVLFTVDVFNEGVDIPRVDTVLFLRPTESATVFIQQLGRGLRLHPEKSCLTVLDFVGNAHRDFRYDLRFRALLGGGTRAELRQAVELDFPRLPSGCSIQLEERAREVILQNLRRTLDRWDALAEDLREDLSLGEYLRRSERAPEEIYRINRTFSELRQRAGHLKEAPTGGMARALARTLHIDDAPRLSTWRQWLSAPRPPLADPSSPTQRLLFAALGQEGRPLAELGNFLDELWESATLREELRQLVEVLDDRRRQPTLEVEGLALRVHAQYSRAEVAAALGLVTERGKLLLTQAGVHRAPEQRCDLLFVTLDKEDKAFTPTTKYQDYPVSPRRFHWESQSRTRADSETGLRYQRPPPGWRILLLVRHSKRDERGITRPFLFLGPVRYLSHEGERPMRILWELEHPTPGDWFQQMKIAAG